MTCFATCHSGLFPATKDDAPLGEFHDHLCNDVNAFWRNCLENTHGQLVQTLLQGIIDFILVGSGFQGKNRHLRKVRYGSSFLHLAGKASARTEAYLLPSRFG